MENITDEYCIKEILKGDSGLFSQLVNKYSSMAFTLAMKIIDQKEDAEESAQDAFLKAYNALNTFQNSSSFKTWFFRIVYNTAISKLRTKKKNEVKLDDIKISEAEIIATENTFEAINNGERQKYLQAAIQKLQPEERALLNLYYFDEFSIQEVSTITGITVSNVKTRIFRSRKKLLQILRTDLKDEIILMS